MPPRRRVPAMKSTPLHASLPRGHTACRWADRNAEQMEPARPLEVQKAKHSAVQNGKLALYPMADVAGGGLGFMSALCQKQNYMHCSKVRALFNHLVGE